MSKADQCRLCLNNMRAMQTIFSSSFGVKYSDLTHTFFGIEVNPDDDLPKQICSDCVHLFDYIYSSKLSFQMNQIILENKEYKPLTIHNGLKGGKVKIAAPPKLQPSKVLPPQIPPFSTHPDIESRDSYIKVKEDDLIKLCCAKVLIGPGEKKHTQETAKKETKPVQQETELKQQAMRKKNIKPLEQETTLRQDKTYLEEEEEPATPRTTRKQQRKLLIKQRKRLNCIRYYYTRNTESLRELIKTKYESSTSGHRNSLDSEDQEGYVTVEHRDKGCSIERWTERSDDLLKINMELSVFICMLCSRMFNSRQTLQYHELSHQRHLGDHRNSQNYELGHREQLRHKKKKQQGISAVKFNTRLPVT